MNNELVIGVIGKIASGKSSLARTLSSAYGCPYVSFGDEVRRVAGERNLPDSREILQAIGAELVATKPVEFCEAVLAQSSWTKSRCMIIDGIRHVQIVEILRRMVAPSGLRLVFVETPEDVRDERLARESVRNAEARHRIEQHSTEAQVDSILAQMADLVVDGTKPVDQLVTEIKNSLASQNGT